MKRKSCKERFLNTLVYFFLWYLFTIATYSLWRDKMGWVTPKINKSIEWDDSCRHIPPESRFTDYKRVSCIRTSNPWDFPVLPVDLGWHVKRWSIKGLKILLSCIKTILELGRYIHGAQLTIKMKHACFI